MTTRRAWGRVLIDGGIVAAIAPMWPEWRGKPAAAFRRAYRQARVERA